MDRPADFFSRHRLLLACVVVALTVVALFGLTRVTVDNDPLKLLRSKKVDFRRLDGDFAQLEGVNMIHLADSFLFTAAQGGNEPHALFSDDGWIVVHGAAFRVDTPNPCLNLQELLNEFLEKGSLDYNCLEGTFSLAAWDARRGRGLALNDQASAMSLYYVEHGGGLYVTTTPIPLARALGLTLDPHGVAEFLARGAMIVPSTIFAGMRRLGLGEHIETSRSDGVSVDRHWLPYEEPESIRSLDEAATKTASVLVDRVRRFGSLGTPVLGDLTGGVDSRLVILAACFAGLDVHATLWGTDDHPDVIAAKRVAEAIQRPLLQFNPDDWFSQEISADLRRQLTYHTNGDVNFANIYHQWLVRPMLAGQFRLQTNGLGGGLMRYFAWGQEFLGVGRRKLANIDNIIRYRFTQGGPPPSGLWNDTQWYTDYLQRVRRQLLELCTMVPNTLTTQQCDAVLVLKNTAGHAAETSSVSSWMPWVAPMLCAGVVKSAIAVPWRMRLTMGFMRRMNYLLSPSGAKAPTLYGGTGSPIRWSNSHRFLWQACRQAGHFAAKVDRIALKGTLFSRWTGSTPMLPARPYLTDEFRQFLNPSTMFSKDLYSSDGLAAFLQGSDDQWLAREKYILRMATLEQICRELDFRPDADFLASSPTAANPAALLPQPL